jgi:hypothetical protein
MDRRNFISGAMLTAASLAADPRATLAESKTVSGPGSFDFVFLTDTHLEPGLDAAHGCQMCFTKIHKLRADFAIHGGDHIYDALGATRSRATQLYDLYGKTEQYLGLKLHHAIGNHDLFGIYPKAGIDPSDPGYGKQLYLERFGKTYYSFDHKGYHFIVLDSIQITADRSWEASIDEDQLAWLAKDLSSLQPGSPVIVVVHVPLVTGAASYAAPRPGKDHQVSVMNAYEVLPLFAGHTILAVLQGHTHINELVTFGGIPYLTRGAVCGNWWHGSRWGTPEGFTVVSLRAGKIDWRYETFGFRSIDPENG